MTKVLHWWIDTCLHRSYSDIVANYKLKYKIQTTTVSNILELIYIFYDRQYQYDFSTYPVML